MVVVISGLCSANGANMNVLVDIAWAAQFITSSFEVHFS